MAYVNAEQIAERTIKSAMDTGVAAIDSGIVFRQSWSSDTSAAFEDYPNTGVFIRAEPYFWGAELGWHGAIAEVPVEVEVWTSNADDRKGTVATQIYDVLAEKVQDTSYTFTDTQSGKQINTVMRVPGGSREKDDGGTRIIVQLSVHVCLG